MNKRIKKISAVILCVLMCGLFITGCAEKEKETTAEETTAPDESLMGTWTEDYFDSGYKFNSDCTGKDVFWDLPFTYTADEGTLYIVFDDENFGKAVYSYSVSGDSLTLTEEDGTSFTYEKK